jgi:hypothetical protein
MMNDTISRTRFSSLIVILAVAVAAVAVPATVLSAPKPREDRPVDSARSARISRAAAQTQARIGQSEADTRALVAATRSRNVAEATGVLKKNGFPASLIEGAKVSFVDNTGGGAAASKVKITIRGGCCPPWIEIIIYL